MPGAVGEIIIRQMVTAGAAPGLLLLPSGGTSKHGPCPQTRPLPALTRSRLNADPSLPFSPLGALKKDLLS